MPKPRPKRKNQRRHAQVRAEQRFGLGVSKVEYEKLCKLIDSGGVGVVFLEKQSLRVSMVALWLGEKWIPVIYDKNRKSIASFLPPEALEPYKEKLEKIKCGIFMEALDSRGKK